MILSKVIYVNALECLVKVSREEEGHSLTKAARQEDTEVAMTMSQQCKCNKPSVRSAVVKH